MIINEDNYLAHYGILRRSGRYPWGSGGPEHATTKSFLGYVEQLRKQGLSEKQIADGFGVTTTQLRAAKSIAKNEQKQADIAMAQRLKDKGYSNVAIGQRMNVPESTVRSLLAPGAKMKSDILQSTASMLKDQVEQKKYIDIGTGVENHLGISQTKLKTAVAMLEEEGYRVHKFSSDQLGTGKQTTYKVLTKGDVSYGEMIKNKDKVQQITDRTDDGGLTFFGIHPPESISSKRVAVRYAEDGGAEADGVIYVRPGVKDVSLGGSRYAQVRIAVDGSHYLKGMAMYKDDLPDGVDLEFNTNKSNTGNKHDAFKKLKDDPDNPFGAVISRQSGVMNIVNEEGDWDRWSKSLSTQFLSKQKPTLAKQQLDMAYEKRKNDLDEIMALTNPAVRKKLLDSYADDADAAAVHLKAAALPRQASHVILPVGTMKETEIYAPNYRNGERVALVRYPHGGTFEIPELTVNNNHRDAKKALGQARDAVGIHPKVAERLSGADFDGDTVLVIPNNHGHVKSTPALEGLKDFDPKTAYPAYEGMPKMSPTAKQHQMGDVSNLITDMTIKGANTVELAAAVRHSMVVIDAEKHNLNYKQSYKDNGIAHLKEKYQGSRRGGSATLISNAGKSSTTRIPKRKERPAREGGPIDPITGKRMYVPSGEGFVGRNGEFVLKKESVPRLALVDDAHAFSSGTPMEKLYADHSNRMKALANQARLEMIRTKTIPYSPSAKTAYSKEVASLNAKLNVALKNAPLERQAQLLANAVVDAKRKASPEMEPAELKKIKGQALAAARNRVGAKKMRIEISPEEWAAIQAGAISNNKLTQILNNSDIDQIRKLATPRAPKLMTSTKKARAKTMLASGYTQAEVADALGVSLTTLKTTLGGE